MLLTYLPLHRTDLTTTSSQHIIRKLHSINNTHHQHTMPLHLPYNISKPSPLSPSKTSRTAHHLQHQLHSYTALQNQHPHHIPLHHQTCHHNHNHPPPPLLLHLLPPQPHPNLIVEAAPAPQPSSPAQPAPTPTPTPFPYHPLNPHHHLPKPHLLQRPLSQVIKQPSYVKTAQLHSPGAKHASERNGG